MNNAILKYINDLLIKEGLRYSYGSWKKDTLSPFWVGSYSSYRLESECNLVESEFTLEGTTYGDILELNNQCERIYDALQKGSNAVLDGVGTILINWDGVIPISSEINGVNRLRITLSLKEWRLK